MNKKINLTVEDFNIILVLFFIFLCMVSILEKDSYIESNKKLSRVLKENTLVRKEQTKQLVKLETMLSQTKKVLEVK